MAALNCLFAEALCLGIGEYQGDVDLPQANLQRAGMLQRNICNQRTFNFRVIVEGPKGDLSGPRKVIPIITQVTLLTTPAMPTHDLRVCKGPSP